jgi:hypothetical protein
MIITRRSGILLLLVIFCLSFSPLQAQDVVSDLMGRINSLRTGLGLSPYRLNAPLAAAANSHAQWMVATGEVTHTQANGSRPVDRAQANGYASAWVAENIYMGSMATVDTAWDFWIHSSIHYAGLTSENYQDIGIGTAEGVHGQAFVLVFGVPSGGGGNPAASAGGATTGNNTQAEAPHYAILGYDAVGNVRYQLQEGETLGDVLLIFGYTWDDLPAVMALNNFTDADIRNLDVGQEILVPPHAGTWTPSPAEATGEVTEPASQALAIQASPTSAANALLPSPTFDPGDLNPSPTINTGGILPTPEGNSSFILPTPTTPAEQIAPPEVFVLASPSPFPSATEAMQISAASTFAPTTTPLPESPPNPGTNSGLPVWLIGAIVVQVGVLMYAGFEFIRRMGRS